MVATSDGLQQLIVLGQGCLLLSARELKLEIEKTNERIREEYEKLQKVNRNYLGDTLSTISKQEIQELVKEKDNKK